jgi:transposase
MFEHVGKTKARSQIVKRRIKYFKRAKGGKVYRHAWIGYSYRRENGTPDFKREISLVGLDESEVRGIEAALRGDPRGVAAEQVVFEQAFPVGAAWAAYCVAENLGIVEQLERLAPKHAIPLMAMVLDRVVQARPHSKLGLWETLPGSPLERVVAPGRGVPEKLHDYYEALEKVREAQTDIQKALFERRDSADSRIFLYDITSSYMEGDACPLSQFGYNRDGKKGKKQIVIGLLTDAAGRPLAVEVFEGNTSDQTTVMDRIDSMRRDFGIEEMIFIGDRGMVTRARRCDLDAPGYEGVKYITALKRQEFLQFLDDRDHPLQLGLFDRHRLVEVELDGVRYILSFNPEKEHEDRATRGRLLELTEQKLDKVRENVGRGRWKSEQVIAGRLHRWLDRWGMARFFDCEYGEGRFRFGRNEERIRQYEAIDGFYVITTDSAAETMDAEETRMRYKSLAQVEQAFRSMKTTELFLRPIRHWNPERVRGHVFVCMLSYLVLWESRNALADVISHEEVSEDQDASPTAACHSVRTVWETLDKEMQIGRIKMGARVVEQMSPISARARQMLGALGAVPSPRRLARLALVG